MNLAKQAEELFFLKCSLLSTEIVEFLEESVLWQSALNHLSSGDAFDTLEASARPSVPADFVVKIEDSPLAFRIVLSREYPSKSDAFTVNVHGNIRKVEQERWMNVVQENRCKTNDSVEFPVYELLSSHLLPLLHEELMSDITVTQSDFVPSHAAAQPGPPFHALLTSHHLISSHKRKSLKEWSEEHNLSGFAKVGYPGVIYCSGARSDVQEFVSKVKNMQWLALHTKFIESLPDENQNDNPTKVIRSGWKEVEKIGEVIEEMKKYGREEYAFDFGIGSGGTKH